MRPAAAGLVLSAGLCGLGCAGLIAEPSPFAGHLDIGFVATGGDAEADGPRIAARLLEAGVQASVTVKAPDRLEIDLTDVVGDIPMERFVAPGRVELVFPEETLTNVHLADAEATQDPNFGRHQVQLTFTADGRARFCELSGAHVQEKVAIRVDGELLMEPVIREAICGGELVITMGGASADPAAETEALAASLRTTEPLAGTWRLERVWER